MLFVRDLLSLVFGDADNGSQSRAAIDQLLGHVSVRGGLSFREHVASVALFGRARAQGRGAHAVCAPQKHVVHA